MAQGAVRAKAEGDVFQGIVFWREAALLVDEACPVEAVEIEYDLAEGVDDVAVFYASPGVHDGVGYRLADFFQCKYHVDRSKQYSSDAFADRSFAKKGQTQSILERFLQAFRKIKPVHGLPRLFLVSNWDWDRNDPLGPFVRESEGKLPDKFFTSGPASALGKVRESWRKHLNLDEGEFEEFARCLRIQVDHLGRRDFAASVYGDLARVGLAHPAKHKLVNPYDALYQRFVTDGPTRFDAKSLLEILKNEELLVKATEAIQSLRASTLGLRSYIRFAERIEEEAFSFSCVSRHFSGRHPKSPQSWTEAAQTVVEFLACPDIRKTVRNSNHRLLLECHGSLALLAGYELSRNSSARVCPVQKLKSGGEDWFASGTSSAHPTPWTIEETALENPGIHGVVVVLSVTRDIRQAVGNFWATTAGPRPRTFVTLSPAGGIGYESVIGAEHACALAEALIAILDSTRVTGAEIVHLFFSAPNSLLFFLGQFREALGRVSAYEYDFDATSDTFGTYSLSISLPLPLHTTTTSSTEDI